VTGARERWLAFRRQQPPTPPLTRLDVSTRGLTFAVWHTPQVPGTTPLVCVNGGMLFDHSLLWPALAPLAHTRQLWLYDQRGRGASSAAPGVAASRIEFDAGDLVALRSALGLARWDVLGHSWGGGISLLAASMDTTGVQRLVLVNAVGVTSRWLPPLHDAGLAQLRATGQHEAAERLAALDPAALVEPVPERHADYSQAFFPAYFADPDFARRAVPPRALSVTGATVAARLRRDGYDWTDRVGALGADTLVLHGSNDVLPIAEAEHTAHVLSLAGVSVQLRALAGAGHNPFWEAPAAFFGAVEAFLARPDPHPPPDS
jgi:pimeloyl-ACP methyl ester carboxylesterase